MTDHKCPRCGTELKVVEVRVPVYDTIHVPGTQVPKTAIKHYEVREEVADCVRCTGSYRFSLAYPINIWLIGFQEVTARIAPHEKALKCLTSFP